MPEPGSLAADLAACRAVYAEALRPLVVAMQRIAEACRPLLEHAAEAQTAEDERTRKQAVPMWARQPNRERRR